MLNDCPLLILNDSSKLSYPDVRIRFREQVEEARDIRRRQLYFTFNCGVLVTVHRKNHRCIQFSRIRNDAVFSRKQRRKLCRTMFIGEPSPSWPFPVLDFAVNIKVDIVHTSILFRHGDNRIWR